MEAIDIVGAVLLTLNIIVPVVGFTYLIRRARKEDK